MSIFYFLAQIKAQTPPESVWFTPPVIAAIISSGVAALLGGFVGAYLKEHYSDKFLKKRRVREITTEINKAIGLYAGTMQLHTRANNTITLFQALRETILKTKLGQATINEAREKYLEQINKHRDSGLEDYKIHTEQSTIIVALSYECQHYLDKKSFLTLRKTIKAFFPMVIQGTAFLSYKNKSFEELLAYQEVNFEVECSDLYHLIESRFERFSETINNLLKC